MILQIALLIGLVLFSVLAILAKDLIKSAIALAVASLLLGIIFFRMNAPYAGVFEISVVAGLITVLFILTIALTKAERRGPRNPRPPTVVFPRLLRRLHRHRRPGHEGPARPRSRPCRRPPRPGPSATSSGRQRTFDLVGQLAVILAGVFAVLALFRKRDKDE